MAKTSRERHLLKTYGITLKQYDDLLKRQNGCCAICQRHHSTFNKNLAVEHNHRNRMIRGLACTYCNRYRIGRNNDSEILRRVADYLEQDTGLQVPVKKKKRKRKK